MSRMADIVEAELVRDGREVLAASRLVLAERDLGRVELRFVATRASESLANVLRVTESRGLRLGIRDPDPDPDDETE